MITKKMVNKTKKLIKKHIPDSKQYQTDEFAKAYLEMFLKVKQKFDKKQNSL